MLFSELCSKEVVSAVTGARLGFIDDAELDRDTAQIVRLFIYGKGEMFGLMGKSEDIVIDWSDIETVGTDVIIIKKQIERPVSAKKKSFLGL